MRIHLMYQRGIQIMITQGETHFDIFGAFQMAQLYRW